MFKTLRILRWTALGLIALLALGTALFEIGSATGMRLFADRGTGNVADPSGDTLNVPEGVPIGGPFRLTDDHGRAVTDAAYRGRWMLVFFGYSNCPDDCPLTLQKMATALRQLGPLADRIAPLFITVDPARDTPGRLASYLANFDPRIIGLTGNSQEIAEAAKAYRVFYSPAEHEQSGADLVNHSSFLYLMDRSGRLNTLFAQEITAERLAAALRARVSEKSAQNAAARGIAMTAIRAVPANPLRARPAP